MQKEDETLSVMWPCIYWKWSDLSLSDGNSHSQNPASLVNTCEYCQRETGTCQEHCQQLNNNKDVCHLPLWRMNLWCWDCRCSTSPEGLQVGFEHSARGNLVELVWRELAVFRNWFHDSSPCISSYLCVLGLVTQFYPTLCDPMDCGPPGSSVYGDSPGKNTRVGSHALLQGIFWTYGTNPGVPHLASESSGKPLHIHKSTKSLNGDISSSWLAEMLFVKLALDCTESYTPTFPHCLLEQSLRVIWGAVSWAAVFILLQIQLNSQFSSCASVLANSIHRSKKRETKMI